ncbi:SURF1 family protein [Marinicella sp. W31]|uniref:SURF1 family protein n=1 Tax=Marinicella sp. W31 TaxID=3023713 RepID=UPI003756798A
MRYKLPLLISLLWLSILCLMLIAGFWQLRRAEEKRQIFDGLENAQSGFVASVQAFQRLDNYQPVKMRGYFVQEPQFLLANQVYQSVPGFHVLTPFYVTDMDAWIVVNRGWVKQVEDGDFVIRDVGVHFVEGQKANIPGTGIQLGEVALSDEPLQEITYFDESVVFPFLEGRLCAKNTAKKCIILPHVIKQDKTQPGTFVRDWKTGLMKPEKHTAYAVQWFAMSAMLLFLYVLFVRKINASSSQK